MKQLYADNHFCESLHSRECIEELYRSADSVKAFLDEKNMSAKRSKTKAERAVSDLYKVL